MSTVTPISNTRDEIVVPSRSMPKPSLGMLYTMSIPLAAGIVHMCDVKVGGLMLRGYIWMLMLVAGMLIFLLDKSLSFSARITFPWLVWTPFVSFVWLSHAWGQIDRDTIQMACQTTMPVFIGVIVSAFIRSEAQLRWLMKSFRWSSLLLAIGFLVGFARASGDLDVVGFRMGSLTCMLIAAVFLTSPDKSRVVAWGGWAICLGLAGVTGARTATLAILVMPILRPQVGKLWAKFVAIVVILLLGVAIFHTSHFQERFFHDGKGGSLQDVIQGKLNTSGRFEAWPLIWSEAWRNPVVGAGVGSSGPYTDLVSNLGGHPHNDYLRVFFELGSVGMALFTMAVVWQSASLLWMIFHSEGAVKHAFEAAWLGWVMFLFTSCTDNTLVYCAAYMNPLFALMGAGYSISRIQKRGTEVGASQGFPCPGGAA